MVDPSDKGSEENKKTCSDCGTSKTPLWRGGPAGPKSLCNACGIRNRKKKRAVLGVKKGQNSNSTSSSCSNSSISSSSFSDNNDSSRLGYPLKERIEVLMRRSSVDRTRKKFGEVEQAAVLLMALSYGYVYA